MNRHLARRALGLRTDPWVRLRLATVDTGRVRDMLDAAIDDAALIQIVGETGAGKSTAFWGGLRERPGYDPESDLVQVYRLDRDQRTIADAVSAIYRTLGTPRPTRGEDRDAQLRQVLGQATRDRADGTRRKLLLLLDDAHHLHWRTVAALKGLRELQWMGRGPLIGVCLLAQRDVLSRTKEIRQRADTLTMAGLAQSEVNAALDTTVVQVLTPDARAILGEHGAGRTWNDLIEMVDTALILAAQSGHRQVERADALQATGLGLRAIAEAVGMSQAEIARQTGSSPTQVSRILSGERTDAALQERIAQLLLSGTPAADTPRQAAAGGR